MRDIRAKQEQQQRQPTSWPDIVQGICDTYYVCQPSPKIKDHCPDRYAGIGHKLFLELMHIVPTDIHAIFVHNLCNICAHFAMHCKLFRQFFAPSTVSALILLKIGENLFGKFIFSCYGHLTILLEKGWFLSKRSQLLLKSVWTKHLAMLSSYQVHPVQKWRKGQKRKKQKKKQQKAAQA